jgi:hypothetical protein
MEGRPGGRRAAEADQRQPGAQAVGQRRIAGPADDLLLPEIDIAAGQGIEIGTFGLRGGFTDGHGPHYRRGAKAAPWPTYRTAQRLMRCS